MGLRDAIAKGVAAAFAATGDIPRPFVYNHYTGTPVRDPNTGEYARTSTQYTGTCIQTEYKGKEGRSNIQVGDLFVIVQQSEVPAAAVDDDITFGSVTYRVLNFEPDPADASFTLQLRTGSV